jgi:hypothetical protein
MLKNTKETMTQVVGSIEVSRNTIAMQRMVWHETSNATVQQSGVVAMNDRTTNASELGADIPMSIA